MATVLGVVGRTRWSVEIDAKAVPSQGEHLQSFEPLQLTWLVSPLDEPFEPATSLPFWSKPQHRFFGRNKFLSTLPANPSLSPPAKFLVAKVARKLTQPSGRGCTRSGM